MYEGVRIGESCGISGDAMINGTLQIFGKASLNSRSIISGYVDGTTLYLYSSY